MFGCLVVGSVDYGHARLITCMFCELFQIGPLNLYRRIQKNSRNVRIIFNMYAVGYPQKQQSVAKHASHLFLTFRILKTLMFRSSRISRCRTSEK